MNKKKWIALTAVFAVLAVNSAASLRLYGAEDISVAEKFTVSVLDGQKASYEFDSSDVKGVSDGANTVYEKNFNDASGNVPVLYGTSMVDLDLAKNAIMNKVEYRFVEHKTGEASTDPAFADIKTKELTYPDLMLDYNGSMTARHYNVDRLGGVGNSGWTSRSTVFAIPSGSIRTLPAHVSHTWDGTDGYISANDKQQSLLGPNYVTIVPTSDKKDVIITTNSVFTDCVATGNRADIANAGLKYIIPASGKNKETVIKYAHAEASKFWGYITPPEDGTYYLGVIIDDGVYCQVTDGSGKDVVIADYLTRDGGFQDFVTTNKKLELKKGQYYPIYLEYWNWGGASQFRLTYSKSKYPATLIKGDARTDNFGSSKNYSESPRRIAGIPASGSSYNSNSNNNVFEMSADWFFPSSNQEPGEKADAKFSSTATKNGIIFPDKPGLYTVEVRTTLADGTTETAILGPFQIIKELPAAAIEVMPDAFTSGNVTLTLKPTKSGTTLTVKSIDVPVIKADGTVGKENIPWNSAAYSASINGSYTFYYEDQYAQPGHAEKTFNLIDRVAPSISGSTSPIINDAAKRLITVSAYDRTGAEAGGGANILDVASGNLKIVAAECGGVSVLTQLLEAEHDANYKYASYTIKGALGSTYKFTAADLVGNTTTFELTVPLAGFAGRPVNNVELKFVDIDAHNLNGGKLDLVEKGRFQAILEFNASVDITDSAHSNGSVTIELSNPDNLAPDFKIFSIVGKKPWIEIGADGKSLVISKSGATPMGTGPQTLKLIVDIGGHADTTIGKEPSITIASISVVVPDDIDDGVLDLYDFGDTTVDWALGGSKKLDFKIVKDPLIK